MRHLLGVAVLALSFASTAARQAPVPGIRELSSDTVTRPVLTGTAAGVPDHRGPFTFAAPYGTQGIRLTEARDCPATVPDCVGPVGYAYWPNLNNSTNHPQLYAVVTLHGQGPSLFAVTKATGAVTPLGPLFAADDPHALESGEGWYFSARQRTTYYVVDWQALRRLDVETHALSTVFDVRVLFGAAAYLWQAHSSESDTVHSFTVRESDTWRALGCGVYTEPLGVWRFYPPRGADFDECQIDRSGRWLLIKEQVDGVAGEDNRLIDLRTDTETVLLDQDGAAGHSDNGRGLLVAHDNWSHLPTTRLWRFGTSPAGPGTIVYEHPTWETGALGHLAYATPSFVVGSDARRTNGPRANEIVAVRLDGSRRVLVLAPTMTDLDTGSAGGDDYRNLPKANVDPTGRYVLWTSNLGTARLDAVIVRIPTW